VKRDPLDYELPQTAASAPRVTPIPLVLSYLVVYVIVATVMVFVLPSFDRVFRDFKVDLPGYTKAVLMFGRWFRDDLGWLWLLPVFIVLPVGLHSALPPPTNPRRRAKIITGISSMVLLIVGVLLLVSLVVPWARLIDATAAGPTK
jgi:hypothetical protein